MDTTRLFDVLDAAAAEASLGERSGTLARDYWLRRSTDPATTGRYGLTTAVEHFERIRALIAEARQIAAE